MNSQIVGILATALLFASACQQKSASPADPADPSAERVETEQPGGEGNLPEGWVVRSDRGAATIAADTTGDIYFVNMKPGWHVTSGPAAIYHHPGNSASGNYRISAEIFLFDPGTRREGFGVIFGGSDLQTDAQNYTYFLIRQGGQYLIKNRIGDETETIVGWTDNDAVKSFVSNDEGPVANKLEVNVSGDLVEFIANGVVLTRIPKSDLKTDGLYGLRINHGLNLHVSDLSVATLD